MSNTISIRGARQHNLKNLNLELPRNKLIVFTGVSGSGKSSLAFDTIFAEGQRRYVESLSAYARQFLGQLAKPEVDTIKGLSPAISIDQKSRSHNPRSTVGTVTEIYDYLRLLYGRAGEPLCPTCGRSIAPQTIDQMGDEVMKLPEGTKFQLLAPVVRGKKGTHKQLLSSLASQGFVRVRVNGEIRELTDKIELKKNQTHHLEIIVDRLINKKGIQERLTDSLATCLSAGEGLVIVKLPEEEIILSSNFACPEHGAVLEELSPRLFSFNSPYGACPNCHGLGYLPAFSPELIIPDPTKPLEEVVVPWAKPSLRYNSFLYTLKKEYHLDMKTLWNELPQELQNTLLYERIIPSLEKQYEETSSEAVKQRLETYRVLRTCSVCQGKRLKPEVLSVRLGQYYLNDLTEVSIQECLTKINDLQLTQRQAIIGKLALKEIKARLQFLLDVGLDYLTLDRPAMTLSGGEAQRIRLATQIGSGLTGVLYVLDEPSIGLHQRDNRRLLLTLQKLRDLGNTLIVVEHDEETIRTADYIVDIGPKAGVQGGEIVAEGNLETLLHSETSLTAAYLSGRKKIPVPQERRPGNGKLLTLKNCHYNNLKHLQVQIPLRKLVTITGVSGSGKSTLMELLHNALQHHFRGTIPFPKGLEAIQGLEAIDKVIVIDQSPIGKTPRSNAATYTGTFDIIRQLFALTIEAKARGYQPGRFSFNVKGGRCEACCGQGVNIITMNFLPDVYVQCDVCKGSRYNRETLQVQYKGYNIAQILNLTITEALGVFTHVPKAAKRLQTLVDVGLGYLKLGQPAPTLSGGEAQRVKLATELSRRPTGKTLYLIDEPTTGLSFYDVHQLLEVLQKLVDKGNSIVVIEHNLDIIRGADWIIDLGPEGGDKGGEIIAVGTPEELQTTPRSYTGQFLKGVL